MDFEEIKRIAYDEAKTLGLKDYELYYMQESSMSAEALKDEISSFSSSVSGGVNFRCIVEGRMVYASTEMLAEKEIRSIVRRAAANAAVIESDNPVRIFEGSKKYESVNSPKFVMPEASQLKDGVLELQRATYACSEYVTEGTQSGMGAFKVKIGICNSCGLELENETGAGYSYVESVVKKGDETDSAGDFCDGIDKKDAAQLPEKATKKALEKLGASEIESGNYDVVFSGKCMSTLLSAFASVFSAKAAQCGLSLLRGKEGEKIASECVTLTDDPMRNGAMMQTSFDGEGVATYRKNVIEKGVLKTLLYDLTTSAKEGKESTGNGQRGGYSSPIAISPYNFYINAGNVCKESLFRAVSDGLYITSLKGLHAGVDPSTGDFSLESAGFLIKGKEKGKAIKSFTIAGNFFDLLKRIEALSDDVYFGLSAGFTVFGSPDVCVRGISVAGK